MHSASGTAWCINSTAETPHRLHQLWLGLAVGFFVKDRVRVSVRFCLRLRVWDCQAWTCRNEVYWLLVADTCVTTLLCRGPIYELATEPFLLLHSKNGTGYRRSWNCCNRRTRFVWAPGYGLTLWCVLSLLVGGAIQVPQLQLQDDNLQGSHCLG